MAAKKKAAAPSLCAQGGPEIQVMGLRVKAADVIDISLWACGTAADIRVVVADANGREQEIANQQGSSNVTATLPGLAPGSYALLWSFLNVSTPWQTRVDVAVNATDRFRQRKDSATSKTPFLRGFLLLEVVP
jgi:hypothetical protein